MRPQQSYRIWFSQRNGSTLLCKGLEETQRAGKPGEHFNLMESGSLCERYSVNSYSDLKKAIWKVGSQGDIFGIKHNLYTDELAKISGELALLQGLNDANHEEIFSDLFPNCKHIYMTRRNKIRQAVSWWKAINDQVWHLDKQEYHQNTTSFYEEKYNVEALTHLYHETILRECAIQQYFSQYNIQALTIVYEDFIANYKGTISAVLEYLNISTANLEIKDPYSQPTANQESEKWVQRFRNDLQSGWQKVIW